MLVLTRKTGQRIMIGEGIEIAVLSTTGDKVRLGITAAKDVPIYREEVFRRIESEDEENTGNGANGAHAEASVDEALQQLAAGSSE